MQLTISINGVPHQADLFRPYDLSQGFGPGGDNPSAFHIAPAVMDPIRVGDFVGSVAAGSGANCEVITFCAHGNGTHTECYGHITRERHSVNRLIRNGLLTACLISVQPETRGEDRVISLSALQQAMPAPADAIIVRCLGAEKHRGQAWSGTNPPYFDAEALSWLADAGYMHFLTNLPSVDREEDGGALSAHHAWWNYPQSPRVNASISELLYIDLSIPDGMYLLNLQVAPVESDAAPSRPVIYPLTPA